MDQSVKPKSIIIYDKWLHTLGGGEVVACQAARTLKDLGHHVTLLSGKTVKPQDIFNKLGIDLKDIDFKQAWNNEAEIKELASGKDFFINISYLDYTPGFSSKNIYYAHFPSPEYTNIKSFLTKRLLFPFMSKFIKPIEFTQRPIKTEYKNNNFSYLLGSKTSLAFSYLNSDKTYWLQFSIFFENIYQTIFDHFQWNIRESKILDKKIKIDTRHNVLHYKVLIRANASTVYLDFNIANQSMSYHGNEQDKIYLLYPKIIPTGVKRLIHNKHTQRFTNRFRSGYYNNVIDRINSYQKIIVHSQYVKVWTKKLWKRNASVIYPPVEMLFEENKIPKKQKMICSLGRFFQPSHGHSKRQDILIDAFIKFHKQGHTDWQLHLIGGLDSNKENNEYFKKLKEKSKNYPIHFHVNAPRKTVEEILLKSKIYWHATGYKVNEKKHPEKLEHFGIAPIEAISAGCIAILYNGGGLKEIIETLGLPNKHLFNNAAELVKNTVYFTQNADYNHRIVEQKLSENFSINAFQKKIKLLVENN